MKLFPSHYLISDCRNEYAHQRADEVEETIRKIGQCGYAQNGGLSHSARVPRDEGRGYGNGIFRGAAQQAAFVSFLLVNVAEHVSGKDDADVLVGCGKIEKYSRTDGGCYHTDRILSYPFFS